MALLSVIQVSFKVSDRTPTPQNSVRDLPSKFTSKVLLNRQTWFSESILTLLHPSDMSELSCKSKHRKIINNQYNQLQWLYWIHTNQYPSLHQFTCSIQTTNMKEGRDVTEVGWRGEGGMAQLKFFPVRIGVRGLASPHVTPLKNSSDLMSNNYVTS